MGRPILTGCTNKAITIITITVKKDILLIFRVLSFKPISPKLMATRLTKFLKRPSNSGKAIIKGKRLNKGGGYGLQVPCM